MSVNNQSPPASASTQKIVAGVTDNEPQIMCASEVDARLHMFVGLRKDDVDSIVSRRARRGGTACRSAGLVSVVGPQCCSGLVGSALQSVRG